MSIPTTPAVERLAIGTLQLLEQLQGVIDNPLPTQTALPQEVLGSFSNYLQTVLSCLPPTLAWQQNPTPTPTELLAEREQSPLYRLGWVRGYQAGQAASQRLAPVDPEVLIQRVRHLLAQLQQRYGTGPLSAQAFIPVGSR